MVLYQDDNKVPCSNFNKETVLIMITPIPS